jgi:DNA mismatch repair ATPase MutS
VSPIHQQLSKVADELSTLSSSIFRIEEEKFESPLLKKWQSVFLQKNSRASADILRIKKILDKLDLRYNLVLSLPLNLLLLWNLQQILDLEKWKESEQNNINDWFDTLANFEALNSFGVLYFNEPEWIFPEIHAEYFSIEGKEIGHPLIPEEKRVNNYIDIPSNAELMLVTGSNMAGKSTYLRSIGVNVVLAMAGAPVCARYFSVSHVQLMTSMRITDNLEESTSTFYAELKKLKTIIEKVNAEEKVFILLDEILRGTNSLDRHTGSKALIKQLIKKKTAAIIATHDLELANLKEDFFQNILNYHFDVQVSNDELYFDYRLKPGICNSLNASILMKKIGIEI